MRSFFVIITLALCSVANAQTSDVRVGPLRIGMSVAELREAAPSITVFDRASGLVSGGGAQAFHVGDRDYATNLIFIGGLLDQISLESVRAVRSPELCFASLSELVTTLEAGAGPFNGAAQAAEGSGVSLPTETTAGGSEIRKFHNQESGAYVGVARTSGASQVIARALIMPGGRTFGCVLTVKASEAGNERPQGLPPAPSTEELAAATLIERPIWIRRPHPNDIMRLYPATAQEQGVEGRVELDCLVRAEGVLHCAVTSETNPGFGFARSALILASMMQTAPSMLDGAPAEGRRVHQGITFALP